MTTKQLLRVAYIVVALAVLIWLGIGATTWSVWRRHKESVAANAAAKAATVAPPVPAPEDTFDRRLSSVQYVRPDTDASSSELPESLAREVDPRLAGERSAGAWITFLREEGVTICWQIAPRVLGQSDPTFAIPVERASVRQILVELCRRDPRYRWECMVNSPVVNVLANERLDAPLGDVSFRPKRLYYCLAELEPHVRVNPPFGVDPPQNYLHLWYWPVSIQAKQITVRDYLNLAVAQYEGMTWTVSAEGILELDALRATRDAVVTKYRDEAPDGPMQ